MVGPMRSKQVEPSYANKRSFTVIVTMCTGTIHPLRVGSESYMPPLIAGIDSKSKQKMVSLVVLRRVNHAQSHMPATPSKHRQRGIVQAARLMTHESQGIYTKSTQKMVSREYSKLQGIHECQIEINYGVLNHG